MQIEKSLYVESAENIIDVFGSYDENVKLIEEAFDVNIVFRQDEINLLGEDEGKINKAKVVLKKLTDMAKNGDIITRQGVSYLIDLVDNGSAESAKNFNPDVICVTAKGRQLKAKTLGQRNYIEAIRKNTIVFGIGPAGTGKTYLAVAMAVNAFRNKEVSRIILTRPAVEAGEKLGFLPGDLQHKVDPYLRPLYDALYDIMGPDIYQKYLEKGIIEVAPLAYMRGRTLDDSFIILDEAQNTTREQMKMFLTRIGFNSKVIVTGDITQIDLPSDKKSGLVESIQVLKNVEDISIVELTHKDVVRHKIVQSVINAYEKYEKAKTKSPSGRKGVQLKRLAGGKRRRK